MGEPWLAVIGASFPAGQGPSPGIHLRWQFRNELGFPPGYFRIYRRVAVVPSPASEDDQRVACESLVGWSHVTDLWYPLEDGKRRPMPECDWEKIVARLPKDPCARALYEANGIRDLSAALRYLFDRKDIRPQAERWIEGHTEADDCGPPGETPPRLRTSTLDLLLLAALDPVIAQVLCLYYVDVPPAGSWDYKVVAQWPPTMRWHLPEGIAFDDVPKKRAWTNVMFWNGVVFDANVRPAIVRRPSALFELEQALAFESRDSFDWNVPGGFPLVAPQAGTYRAEIRFPKNVLEAQLYIGQTAGGTISVDAWRDELDRKVNAVTFQSTRAEDIIAIRGDDTIDLQSHQFNRLVVTATRPFWIYQVRWGYERLPGGSACACVFGLKTAVAAGPVLAPDAVTAKNVVGAVRKVADCEALNTGQVADGRGSVGVSWTLPPSPTFNVGAPVRYWVERVEPDGTVSLVTPDPIVATIPSGNPAIEIAGWSPPPMLLDTEVQLWQAYRYRVTGIDLFGRESVARSTLADVVPRLPAPPPPARVHAAHDPSGAGDAIRLRWIWAEGEQRQASDTSGFLVCFAPGIPNVLECEVLTWAEASGTATVALQSLLGIGAVAGRMLRQGRNAYRIASNTASTATRRITAVLQRPRLGNARPVAGPCTIPLQASVPFQLLSAAATGPHVQLTMRTSSLAQKPSTGLLQSTVRVGNAIGTIDQVVAEDYRTTGTSLTVRVRVDDDARRRFLRIGYPVFGELQLPGGPLVRDYTNRASWSQLVTIPNVGGGDYEVMVKTQPAAGVTVTEVGDRRFVVTCGAAELKQLFDVSPAKRQQKGCFGVASLRQDGDGQTRYSPVSAPSKVQVSYAGRPGGDAEIAQLSPLQGEARVFASRPRFDGTSSYELSWPNNAAWSYSVFRALDESVFAVDAVVRAREIDGVPVRSRVAATYAPLLAGYTIQEQAVISQLIIQPPALDRGAIEASPIIDKLLRVLGALPNNEDAFTMLRPEGLRRDAATVTFRDDTIAGRTRGRLLYRVRSSDANGNKSPFGNVIGPIYVRGERVIPAPRWEVAVADATSIRLRWRQSELTGVTGFRLFRTSDTNAVNDVRLMDAPVEIQLAVARAPLEIVRGSVQLPALQNRTVAGVFVAGDYQRGALVGAQAATNWYAATEGSRIRLSEGAPNGATVVVVHRDSAGAESISEHYPGLFEYSDRNLRPATRYGYRVQPVFAAADEVVISELSTPMLQATSVRIPAPTPVATPAAAQVSVTWPALPVGTRVLLQRRQGDAQWAAVSAWRDATAQPIVETPGAGSFSYRLLVAFQTYTSSPSAPSGAVEIQP